MSNLGSLQDIGARERVEVTSWAQDKDKIKLTFGVSRESGGSAL
jgi:hypothetical protein